MRRSIIWRERGFQNKKVEVIGKNVRTPALSCKYGKVAGFPSIGEIGV